MTATLEQLRAQVAAQAGEIERLKEKLKTYEQGPYPWQGQYEFMLAENVENQRLRAKAETELSRYREPSDTAISRAAGAWLQAKTHPEAVLAVLAAVREGGC